MPKRPYDARIDTRIEQLQGQRAQLLAAASAIQSRISALQSMKGKLASGRMTGDDMDVLVDEGLEKEIL
jgi:hypothetical protein